MRVVALVPGGIGNQILFFPTLDSLKQNYPNVEIDVVVEPRAKAAYRVCKSVDEVLTFDYKDQNSPADWANLLGVLRDRYHDVAMTTGQGWGIGLLLWLTGIAVRIGYSGSGAGLFLTNSIPLKSDQYQADVYHDLLQGLNITTPSPSLAISIPKVDLDWADAEQKRLGVSSYVLIYGGPRQFIDNEDANGLYPIEKWHAIIQDFQKRQPDLPLVVVQEPGDQEFVPALIQASPTLKVTKPGDIGKLAAMIAGANLMLCVNSVPMQLAIALQVYTLALFGSTNPEKRLPKNDKFQSIQSSTGNIADISPEHILATIWGG